jgi:WD40 repeat protein
MSESPSTNGESGATATQARVRTRSVAIRFGLVPDPPASDVYHGFISYSHSADGKLARELQKGLQQFAKPWYRTRALHIFRDDAALSANPELWGSVRQALNESQYFILLASPESARSQWVTREVSYWRDHKEPKRILIGLTDGELAFGNGGHPTVPMESNALPSPLEELYEEEPRYIDLRWARDAGDLGISHPRFRDAIAELAAPIHGKPKDELASDEVREHRRTVRLARGAAAAILALLVLAIAAAVIALVQRSNAVTEATIATSRQLSAVSETQLGTNLNVALPLAARAYRTSPNPQSRAALFQADLFSPHLVQFLPMGSRVMQVVGSGNGQVVAAGLADGQVKRWSRGAPSPASAFRLPSSVSSVAVDNDGGEVVATDGSRAMLWRSGQHVASLQGPAGVGAPATSISPSGRTVAVYYRQPNRGLQGPQSVAIFDVERGLAGKINPLPSSSWAPTALVEPNDAALLLFDGTGGNWQWRRISDWAEQGGSSARFGVHQAVPGYANDGSAFTVTNGASTIPVWPTAGRTDGLNAPLTAQAPISVPSALTLSPGGRQAAVADNGTIYVSRVAGAGAAHGSALALPGNGSVNPDGIRFFSDGSHLLSASNDTVAVWDLAQLDRLARVYPTPLDPSPCNGCSGATIVVSPDGQRVAALDDRGTTVVQRIGTGQAPEVVNGQGSSFAPPVWDRTGQLLLALSSSSGGGVHVLSPPGSSTTVRELRPSSASDLAASGLSADGRVLLVNARGDIIEQDPATGLVVSKLPGPRDLATSVGLLPRQGDAAIDAGDGLVATVDRPLNGPQFLWGAVIVRTAKGGRLAGSIRGSSISSIAYAGSRLLVQLGDGRLEVWSANGHHLERTIPGDQSFVPPMVGSPNGALVARQRADGSVVLADLETGSTLATFPAPADPALGLRIGLGFPPSGTELIETVQTIAGSAPKLIERDVSSGALVAAACRAGGGALTAAQWEAFVGTAAPSNLACP